LHGQIAVIFAFSRPKEYVATFSENPVRRLREVVAEVERLRLELEDHLFGDDVRSFTSERVECKRKEESEEDIWTHRHHLTFR